MAVLKRNELEQSPLADLHALAADLGLEGFRRLRKGDLIDLMVGDGGGSDSEAKDDDSPAKRPARARGGRKPASKAVDKDPGEDSGKGGGRGRGAEKASDVADGEIRTGTLDVLANGSGFLRADPDNQARDDVYVSPAQIRRCELKAGDEVSGPVRPPRRSERYPSLVRVATVNGADADSVSERPRSEAPPAVFAVKRLAAPTTLKATPFGRGSRVVVAGPPGAGATTLLREIAKKLSKSESDLALTVVLAGIRPEEIAEWRTELEGVNVEGGSFDQSSDRQADAAKAAVDKARKTAEAGDHAAIVVDSLDGLSQDLVRRVLGAARNTEDSGSITVIAACSDPRAQRYATTRIVLTDKGDGSVDSAVSGTLRADLLK